jgi:purine-binding chemotaxis protein CheW
MKKVLTFQINSETYCFDVMNVVSIDQKSHITEIPLAPQHVLGVINLRGQIIPVIDLRKLFQMTKAAENRESCSIFIETEAGRLGCVVDAVCDVIELTEGQYESVAADSMSSQTVNYIDQILKIKDKINFLLNTNRLYDSISNINTTTLDKVA